MTLTKTIAISAASALIAGGGGAALAASHHGTASKPGAAHAKKHRAAKRFLANHPRLRQLTRSVHAEAVVPTSGGTQFATVTFDRGKVTGVSGDQLTLREGTKKAAYKTVTLTIPAAANVRDNGRKAALADVKTGQTAAVFTLPKRTAVVARDTR